MVTPSALPQRVLQQIRSSIAQRTGLAPQDWVLEARVRERMRAKRIEQVQQYAELLSIHSELTALVELLRVGETRFFRHESHMRALTNLILPELRKSSVPARVWSAGCATGEEPYTLAMLLSRELAGCREVSVLASDISPASLRVANEGIYRDSALGTMSQTYRSELEVTGNGLFQVPKRVRSMVTFEERNLAKGAFPGDFDLIFCRNVLIYFEEEAKDIALGRLVNALKPGAFLFLGYSESLRDVAGLEVVSNGECRVYRRKLRANSIKMESQSRARAPASAPPATSSAARTPPPAELAPPLRISLCGEYRNGTRLAEELDSALQSPSGLITVDLDGADFLGHKTAEVLRNMRAKAKAQGVSLSWRATRDGHLRFLRRHNLHSDGENQ